jgi:site-specific recombinase XerD
MSRRLPQRSPIQANAPGSKRRLETQQKSESTLVGYRVAIDDLLDWSETNGCDVLAETAIVDYLHSYQERAQPAEASYYRRFVLLRKFVRWVCRRDGVPDPFLDLDAPPEPRQERDWLTPEEFRHLLDAAGRPERNLPGLAERDRLVLLALVTTGLRRSEVCALEWLDLELGGREPSLLVRRGKGSKSRRQPLPASLARELRRLRARRQTEPADPVFCGLAGGRLQETILADIIRRAAKRAGIEKHVTAHTLRHTAATWLRQELGDTRLVAEYLGHADLSNTQDVSRFAYEQGPFVGIRYRSRLGDDVLNWAIFEPAPDAPSPFVAVTSTTIEADDPDLRAALGVLGLVLA